MEQLEHPLVAVQLAQRGNGAMGENAIGLFQDFLEVGIRNAAGNEWSHDPERQFVIRQAAQEAISSTVKRGRFSGT